MIKLHVFGPAFGMPDPSPFVIKADLLLKLSGQPYEATRVDVRKAPKGKLPVIVDDGVTVADSTFIRFHLEDKYGIDFDAGLSPAERGAAWALEKLCEDHLYWIEVKNRWMENANFDKGPRRFFEAVPLPLRPVVTTMIRSRVRKALWLQGLGRHSAAELTRLGKRGIDSISAILGDKPFMMGPKACAADATAFAFVASLLCKHFDSDLRIYAEGKPNLVAYRDRGMQLWYPELAKGRTAA